MEAGMNITDRNTVSTAVFLELSIPFKAKRPILPKTSAGIRRTLIRPQRGCTVVDIKNIMTMKEINASIAIVSGKFAYLFFIGFYAP